MNRQRAQILLPALCIVLDTALTLVGQSDAYWAGDRNVVRELNPLANFLLQHSPAAFIGLAIGWIGLVSTAIYFLPDRFARLLAIVVGAGHLLGASTWLIRYPLGIIGVLFIWKFARLTLRQT